MPQFILLIAALLALWLIRFVLGWLISQTISSKIVVIRRMPPIKVLRAHQLALTCALALSLLAILVTAIATDVPYAGLIPFLPLLVLVLFVGSIWGWPWLLIIGLGVLWFFNSGAASIIYLGHSVEWYLWGYILGAVLATLYNDLAYWLTLTLRRKDTRVAWAFHTDYPLNIIKSPNEDEMTVRIRERSDPEGAINVNEDAMAVEVDPEQRLYDFKIDPIPPRPYTIAFVANPWVLKYDGDPEKREDWVIDPIIRDRDLFLRMVDWGLSCLEQDEIVGQHEIWSRVRIIAMFNGDLIEIDGIEPKDYGMLQPYHNQPYFDGEIAENLIDPITGTKEKYLQMISHAAETGTGASTDETDNHEADHKMDIDVIFALSASPQYTRCTAHFSDWEEDKDGDAYLPPPEAGDLDSSPEDYLDKYIYCPDPELTSSCPTSEEEDPKKCSKDTDSIHVYKCGERDFKCEHEYYANIPGRVALNVIGANSRTFVHEFAHAMSSAFRGAIVDEYFDHLEAHSKNPVQPPHRGYGPFMINRIERDPNAKRLVPIPKVFAEYQCMRFNSDLSHPSARENWVGYFPDRIDPNATCIMDRSYYYSRFDELLSNFIYDRLVTKINRG